MRAVVVDRPGGPEVLQVRDVPVPRVEPGQVLVRVHAFGLNRSAGRGGRPARHLALCAQRGHGLLHGMLSDHWTIPEFYPMDWLPNGVRLTAYSGDAADLPAPVLQELLDAVADGRAQVPVGQVYRLDQIAQAHTDMEAGTVGGKRVVVL